jgi:hypothetical protein
MEDLRRKERRNEMENPNLVGDISLLESPMQNVGTVARSGISVDTTRKRKRRIRRKSVIAQFVV